MQGTPEASGTEKHPATNWNAIDWHQQERRVRNPQTADLSGNPGGRVETRPLTAKAHVAQPSEPHGERQTSGATQYWQTDAGGG